MNCFIVHFYDGEYAHRLEVVTPHRVERINEQSFRVGDNVFTLRNEQIEKIEEVE